MRIIGIELLPRKERIVLTAIDVMNEYGIHSLSTREIARREGITEGAIYKHFSRKVDIMLAVLEHFSKYDEDINKSIEVKQLEPIEAILYFFEAYGTYYENYSAITVILLSFDQMRYNLELVDSIKSIIANRSTYVSNIIRKAQQQGDLRNDVNHELLADIIMGSFNRICFRWRLNNCQYSLKDKGLESTKAIIDAFKK